MTLAQIRNILHGTSPFTIRMIGGRQYVTHPDFVALSRDFATLVLTDQEKFLEVIRLSQVESINVASEPAA